MKPLFLILLCLAFVSCGKEYCWKCHYTTITHYSNGTASTQNGDEDVCNKTSSEIKDYEKAGNYVRNDAAQGITITQSMSCTK